MKYIFQFFFVVFLSVIYDFTDFSCLS
uniref:Uncharacterized protein n=1 Tax=Anguilla anguilla TaxID=7936 RepID=A0A0E9XT54_ANGAN